MMSLLLHRDPIEKHYRIQFYQFIDRIPAVVSDKFSVGSTNADFRKCQDLSRTLKPEEISAGLEKYPEIDFIKLKIQMKAFRE